MSVEQLKLIDSDAIAQLVASHADGNFMFIVDSKYNPHSIVLDLDRNQAHLLKLWLEEHLTPNIKKLKDTMGDMQLCGCGLYHHKDWICEKISK